MYRLAGFAPHLLHLAASIESSLLSAGLIPLRALTPGCARRAVSPSERLGTTHTAPEWCACPSLECARTATRREEASRMAQAGTRKHVNQQGEKGGKGEGSCDLIEYDTEKRMELKRSILVARRRPHSPRHAWRHREAPKALPTPYLGVRAPQRRHGLRDTCPSALPLRPRVSRN